MPTRGQMLKELADLNAAAPKAAPGQPVPPGPSPVDILRRKYLVALNAHTGRDVIVYATAWLENKEVDAQALSVNPGDKQGFMEAVSNLKSKQLDLFLTSPGGSPEAAEAIMGYLRTRFDHIRAIVPVAAMSAATMMALACDEIVMGSHSQLGPIDPQFTVHTPEGPRSAPGQAILDQWELAKQECQDPKNLGAWLPLLRSLLPGLIAQCHHSRALAEQFVAAQLEAHMFAGDAQAATKGKDAAAWFADFSTFKSHGRPVSRDDARGQGILITDLESDPDLQDLVLGVHHGVRHTFNSTGATKIIENHAGRAYLEMIQQLQIGVGAGPSRPALPGTPAPPPTQLNPSRTGTPSRNAPCPCGSGKKYKQCHGSVAS